MSSSTRLIRPVTADEMLASGVARGWESQPQEASFWFTEDMIEGSLPAELQGTFFRNGPGLTEVYGTKLKHPIDGDGVVCALTLHGGRAHFKSRFVRTASHVAEEEAGQMLFQGQMGSRVPPPAAGRSRSPSPSGGAPAMRRFALHWAPAPAGCSYGAEDSFESRAPPGAGRVLAVRRPPQAVAQGRKRAAGPSPRDTRPVVSLAAAALGELARAEVPFAQQAGRLIVVGGVSSSNC